MIDAHVSTRAAIALHWTVSSRNLIVVQHTYLGRNYGEFTIQHSPTDDGKVIEIPLSYDAIYDVNAAAGELFSIGLGPGDIEWVTEGEYIYFLMPDEGGIVQLEFTLLPTFGKHHGKIPCIHSHSRPHDDD